MSDTTFRPGERLRAAKLNRLAGLSATFVQDAPADGGLYVRQNGAWVTPNSRATVETVTGATHAPAVGVDGRYFVCTNAGGCVVTIPLNATQAFPIGTMLTYQQDNTGAVTIQATGGVTLRVPNTYTAVSNGRYSVVQVCKTDTNTWTVYGNLALA